MSSIIIPKEQLKATLQMIQDVLNTRYDVSEPVNMLTHLEELGFVLGNSTLAEASARYWMETAKREAIKANEESKLAPSIMREYINSLCAGEISSYELAERQHSALVHKIDAVRSSLSYLKSEMNNT